MTDIVRTDGILGGEPRIDDTRIGVYHVYELVVEGNNTPADVADQLDVSLGAVYTALAYYHEHPDEMRELRRAHEDAVDVLASDALRPPETAR